MLKLKPLYSLLFFAATTAFADQETVSLQDFMTTMIATDPVVANILLDNEQAKFSAALEQPSDHITLKNKTQLDIIQGEAKSAKGFTTTVAKPLPTVGSQLELSHKFADGSLGSERTLGLIYEQSLIKNFLGRDYTLATESSQLSDEIVKQAALQKFSARVTALFSLYFDYLLASIRLEAISAQIKEAQRLATFVRRKARNGVANKVDVARSTHQVLTKLAEREPLEQQIAGIEQAFKWATRTNIRPKTSIRWANANKLANLALTSENGPDHQGDIYRLEAERAKLAATLADRSSSPELAAFVGIEREVVDGTRLKNEDDKIVIGLNFQMALGSDSTKEAKYQRALFQQQKSRSSARQFQAEQQEQVAGFVTETKSQLKLIDLSERRVRNAKKIAAFEKRRYETGRIDLDRLISAQDLVTAADLAYLRHHVALRRAAISLLHAKGRLTLEATIVAPWQLLE